MPRPLATFFLPDALTLSIPVRLFPFFCLFAFLLLLKLIIDAPWPPSLPSLLFFVLLTLCPSPSLLPSDGSPQPPFSRSDFSSTVVFTVDSLSMRSTIRDPSYLSLDFSTLAIPLFYPNGLADHEVALFYAPKGNLLFVAFSDARLFRLLFISYLLLVRLSSYRCLALLIDSPFCSDFLSLASVRASPSTLLFSLRLFLPLIARIYLG